MSPEPFDLDAFVNDTERAPFRFVLGGEDWEWPGFLDLRVTMSLEGGNLEGALRQLFGPEQWQRFRDLDAVFDHAAFMELFRQHAKHIGSSLGESGASTGSSRSTGRPSKRTSQSTIK